MKLRKLIFWLHLIAGISTGLVVLIMSITGVLLAYEKQIISWVDRDLRAGPAPSLTAKRLPMQAMLATAREASGATPATLTLYAESPAAAIATSGPTVYIDAYDGQVIGTSSGRTRAFFRKATEWHRYVALAGDNRPLGKAITGAANLVFLFIVISGIYLWWRGATAWFKRGLKGKALFWNWHNVLGVWTFVPLFLVVLSATVISYPWASNLVYRLTGSEVPPAGQAGNGAGAPSEDIDLASADFAIAHMNLQVADWKSIAVRLQPSRDGALTLTVDRGNGGQPHLRSTITVGRDDGTKFRLETFADQSLGRRARSWLRFVHTGEYYGIAGQTVAAIASLAAVMLVWTGFALSLSRFSSWSRQRNSSGRPAYLRGSA